jgi:organic hydroperoxide reductase OsmC/OhrA
MSAYPHHYVTSASGENEGNVVVSSEGLPDLDTQAPPQFGGPEGLWSPETMLSASVANCFILSFRAIARASKFAWSSLDCSVDAVLDRPERVTYFTEFKIRAVLSIPADSKPEMAERLLEKAEKICLVTASLKSETSLSTEILID